MIRDIEYRDIETLIDLGEKMHNEGHFKNTEYNRDKLRELAYSLINDADKCCFVAERNNVIIGFFMGGAYFHYFGNTMTCCDFLTYVDKDYRGGSTGAKLIAKYIKWALDLGIDRNQIRLGDSAEIDSQAVDRLFKFMGFREHGRLYVLGD